MMGRPKRWAERILLPLAAGTLARVAAVLAPDEDRTDFMRDAVEREIKRREKASAKPAKSPAGEV